MRPMTPIFDLYFWPTPNGYKISIMLEELGVDYQLVPINITEGEQHEERFDIVSPNHKIPALTHYVGEGGLLSICLSQARSFFISGLE